LWPNVIGSNEPGKTAFFINFILVPVVWHNQTNLKD